MLSSPLMMNHVRSYYQNKTTQPTPLSKTPCPKNKYIRRTRASRGILPVKLKGSNDVFSKQGLSIRKRDFEDLVNPDLLDRVPMKVVLRKEQFTNQGLGKFSLKRVSHS